MKPETRGFHPVLGAPAAVYGETFLAPVYDRAFGGFLCGCPWKKGWPNDGFLSRMLPVVAANPDFPVPTGRRSRNLPRAMWDQFGNHRSRSVVANLGSIAAISNFRFVISDSVAAISDFRFARERRNRKRKSFRKNRLGPHLPPAADEGNDFPLPASPRAASQGQEPLINSVGCASCSR